MGQEFRAETLAYTYTSGTNRLGKVTVGGSQKSYAYNADGTMKTDGLGATIGSLCAQAVVNHCTAGKAGAELTNGKEWRDSKGNKIVDHSNIHVYIFYDPKSIKRQSNKMYHDAVVKYGERSVAMSDVTTVQDLPAPTGDISHAQLNLNTCKSNSKTQHELKGSRQTLMEAFFYSFDFKTVRGTSHGVSYDNLWRLSYQRNSGVGLPSK